MGVGGSYNRGAGEPMIDYACGHGHILTARTSDGAEINLEGHLCAACLGSVIGHQDLIDGRLLAPMQKPVPPRTSGERGNR